MLLILCLIAHDLQNRADMEMIAAQHEPMQRCVLCHVWSGQYNLLTWVLRGN